MSPAGRHALRLAVVVPAAELISRQLPLQRGYWMVAATALRPEFAATFTRGTERALGTCVGVAMAGAIAVGLHPAGGVTVALVGLLAWAGYASQGTLGAMRRLTQAAHILRLDAKEANDANAAAGSPHRLRRL